jgi:hypothetical protein
MLSGAAVSVDPTPSFTSFNNFSTAVGCKQAPGPSRLACLKRVPTSVIRNYTNGPASGSFRPVSDGYARSLVSLLAHLSFNYCQSHRIFESIVSYSDWAYC